MSSNSILYPNVTSIPSQVGGTGEAGKISRKQDGIRGEFDQVFDQALKEGKPKADLNQIKQPLKLSSHAAQRLNERKIHLNSATMAKINDAIDKAEAKGVEDTLILTPDAALIVSVKNRTVITAMDKNSLIGNVFTNIDGAVII